MRNFYHVCFYSPQVVVVIGGKSVVAEFGSGAYYSNPIFLRFR